MLVLYLCLLYQEAHKANSAVSNVSSVKRQEAAAEYAATQAVLKIMVEQEVHQEKLQT